MVDNSIERCGLSTRVHNITCNGGFGHSAKPWLLPSQVEYLANTTQSINPSINQTFINHCILIHLSTCKKYGYYKLSIYVKL